MRLDKDWIAQRIPHAGSMCLLDEVLEWSADRILCRSGTHRGGDNPLRAHGRLGAVCAVEYAAQAMAVHGALAGAADAKARPGYLASVRGLVLRVSRIDDIDEDLLVAAARLAGDASGVTYEFNVLPRGAEPAAALVSGRATILFGAGPEESQL